MATHGHEWGEIDPEFFSTKKHEGTRKRPIFLPQKTQKTRREDGNGRAGFAAGWFSPRFCVSASLRELPGGAWYLSVKRGLHIGELPKKLLSGGLPEMGALIIIGACAGLPPATALCMNTPPNRWQMAFAILAVGAFCAMGCVAIQFSDQTATLDMFRDHDQRIEAALAVLRTAMPEALRISGRVSKNDILAMLQQHYPAAHIVSGPLTVEMDEIRFCFASDGSLDRIEQTDDYGTLASDSPTNRATIH